MAVVDQYLSGRQLKNLQISLRTAFCVLPKKIASHGVAIVVRFVSSNKTAVRWKEGGGGYGRDEWWIMISVGLDGSVKIAAFFPALKFEWETSPSQPDFLNRAVRRLQCSWHIMASGALIWGSVWRCEFVLPVLLGSTEVECIIGLSEVAGVVFISLHSL